MTISRVLPSGAGLGDVLTSTQITNIDLNATYAVDKRSGQTDTLQSVVSCSGAGRVVPTGVAGADADTTSLVSSGIQVIDATTGLSAPRIYTLSITGAVTGDQVQVLGGAQNVTVKDGFDNSDMLIVGTATGANWASATFRYNGTRWRVLTGNLSPSASTSGAGVVLLQTSPTIGGVPVLSGASMVTSNNAKGTVTNVNPVNVQTTDATTTILDSFVVASNSGGIASWLVTAIRADSGQGAAYTVTVGFRNQAGTPAIIATPQVIPLEDNTVWDVTSNFSGTTLRLLVTGVAATTIQWTAVCTRLVVIP
jgi:hypothetical protein